MHKNRVELITLLLGSRYQTIINKSSADFINLLQLHINQSVSGYLVPSLKLIADFLVALLIVSYLLISHPKVTLILLAVTGISSLLYIKMSQSRLYKHGKDSYLYNHAMIDLARSMRTGFVDIIVNGGAPYFNRLFSENSLKFSNVQIQNATLRLVPRPLFEWITISFVIFVVLLNSSVESKVGLITLLTTFGVAAIRLLPAVTSVIGSLSSMRSSEAAVDKYFAERSLLLNEVGGIKRNYVLPIDVPSNEVRRMSIKNVSFFYQKENLILNSISVELKKGDVLGIVGPSGSGKSTLLSIIIGLIKPSKGAVFLNDKNVIDLPSSEYFAYVPQFPFISNDTLINNIVYPGRTINLNEVRSLMDRIGLSDLNTRKVAGLNTLIGEKGVTLSGGQAQRVALIRAILMDKDVLIIDEGTSALDDDSSQLVLELLAEVKEEKIIIIASHRKEILALCNKTFSLEDR